MSETEEVTRDLRRSVYLAEAVDQLLLELEKFSGVALQLDARHRALGVIHRHLSMAWNDGARREADLRAAVDTLHVHKRRLEAELQAVRRALEDVLKRRDDGET